MLLYSTLTLVVTTSLVGRKQYGHWRGSWNKCSYLFELVHSLLAFGSHWWWYQCAIGISKVQCLSLLQSQHIFDKCMYFNEKHCKCIQVLYEWLTVQIPNLHVVARSILLCPLYKRDKRREVVRHCRNESQQQNIHLVFWRGKLWIGKIELQ